MKKTILAIALVLATVALLAVPVMAAAQKASLIPCTINYPEGTTPPPGGGFVIFNNSSGPNNLEMTLSLKGVLPNTEYDIYLFVDTYNVNPGDAQIVGTVKTNRQGNATFHLNTAVSRPRSHTLNVDVTLKDSGSDIYELPGIAHVPGPTGGVTLNFK